MLDEKLGKWFFWLFLAGFNLTFLIQHVLGILGMPRRVFTYPDLPWYGIMNFTSSAGAFLMGGSVFLLGYILIKSIKSGKEADNDPWDAFTLEWMTSSPPGLKNFDEVPVVKGLRPLWDMKQGEEKGEG